MQGAQHAVQPFVQLGSGHHLLCCSHRNDPKAKSISYALKDNHLANRFLFAASYPHALSFQPDCERGLKIADPPVEEEFLRFGAGLTDYSNGRRICRSSCVVRARVPLAMEVLRGVRNQSDRAPVNSVSDPAGLGIPLGDGPRRKSDFHRNPPFLRRIEIEDRGLHANRSGKNGLGNGMAKLPGGARQAVDKGGQLRWRREWSPRNHPSIFPGHGGESSPLVHHQWPPERKVRVPEGRSRQQKSQSQLSLHKTLLGAPRTRAPGWQRRPIPLKR